MQSPIKTNLDTNSNGQTPRIMTGMTRMLKKHEYEGSEVITGSIGGRYPQDEPTPEKGGRINVGYLKVVKLNNNDVVKTEVEPPRLEQGRIANRNSPKKSVKFAAGTKEMDGNSPKASDQTMYRKLPSRRKRVRKMNTYETDIPLTNRFSLLDSDEEEESEDEEDREVPILETWPKRRDLKKDSGPIQVFINDVAFNEKETEEAKKELTEKGFYQPSITQLIEDRTNCTELGLVDETPLTNSQFLALFDTQHLRPEDSKTARDIFSKHREAFAEHKYDIGKTDKIEMDIELLSNEPKMQKYTPIPFNVRDQVKDILDQLLKHDIIRVCKEPSPYCSNILVVKKKDGNSIRLLYDGRLLNYDTKRYPMAQISKQEIVAHLIGKTHLSSLDFADAFFHIPLVKEAQPLTAFWSHTHGQRMCFTRAPQGLKNSPMYLKSLLDDIFKDMTDSVLFYADDLLIATNGTLHEHLQILDKVLEKLVDAGLKLRPQKLLIAKENIEFLGMVFRRNEMSIPHAKLEAFRNLPSPTTPKKCKSLIMCLSYYRQFCPRFAELSREIMELSTLHGKQFKWTAHHEQLLRTLIETICTNASLYLPNPARTFYVQTDASQFCAGGRIFQKDKEGQEQLVAAVSRTFTKTERAYSIFKKEILALLYTLKSMDFFLKYAKKLVILVDAKSITYLRLAKESSGILLRFSLELSKYNAEIFHVAGADNVVSDVLSRHHPKIDQIEQEIEANATLDEKTCVAIVKRMTLPDQFHLTVEETKALIEGNSPRAFVTKKVPKSKAVGGTRSIKNTPNTLGNKKANLPKTTKFRPGMLLPTMVANTRRNPRRDEAEEMQRTRDTRNLAGSGPLSETVLMDRSEQDDTSEDDSNPRNVGFATEDIGQLSDGETSSRQSDTSSSEDDSETGDSETRANVADASSSERSSSSSSEDDSDTGDSETRANVAGASSSDRGNNSSTEDDSETGDSETRANVADASSSEGEEQMPRNEVEVNSQPQENEQGDIGEDQSSSEEDDILDYTDVRTNTNVVSDGVLSVEEFKRAQFTDRTCMDIVDRINVRKVAKKYYLEDGFLFRIGRDKDRLVLPKSLFDAIIFTKHFSVYGAHSSAARILRDIKDKFYLPDDEFEKRIRMMERRCYICQLYDNREQGHTVKALPKVGAPRISWSIDVITDAPVTATGLKQILLCVDDFSSYVVCIPLTSATARNVLEGLETKLFNQFGVPRYIRSDQQSTFYNSNLFCETLQSLGIDLQVTGVASPFSNGRAEAQIKNLKHLMRKFLFQEHVKDNWNKYLHILSSSHNKSMGIYGHSAEEIMFGNKIPSNIDILSFNADYSMEQYLEHVLPVAEKLRKDARKRMEKKSVANQTFKNKNTKMKEFPVGTLVLHRQLQASTGTSSKYKPMFTGPYIVIKVNKDRSTAILQNLRNERLIKAHFTNMQSLYYAPEINRLSEDFDKDFFNHLGEKYTLNRYKEANARYIRDAQPDLIESGSPEY